MASIKLILSPTKKNGFATPKLFIIHERKHRELNLKLEINPALYKHGKVMKEHPHAAKINERLSRAQHVAHEVIVDHAGEHMSVDELRKRIAARLGYQSKTPPVKDFTETLIKELNATGRGGNAEVYKHSVNNLVAYAGNIMLHQIDYQVLVDWKASMAAKPSTVSTRMRTVRIIINEAIRRGILSRSPFVKGLIPSPGTPPKKAVHALAIQQLEKIRPSLKGLARLSVNARLLQFYLQGMDIIDLAHIQRNSIKDGYVRITRYKNRSKGDNYFLVKISPKAQQIIDEYKDKYLIPVAGDIDITNHHQWSQRRKHIDRSLSSVCAKNNIPNITAKAIRHTWLTIAAGITDNYLLPKLAVGHVVKDITAGYIKTPQEDIDRLNEQVINSVALQIVKAQTA